MRHPLPYAFARTAQLLLEDDGQQPVLWHGPAPDMALLGEVLRKHAVRHLQVLDAAALAQRISAAYAQGESSAATVVSNRLAKRIRRRKTPFMRTSFSVIRGPLGRPFLHSNHTRAKAE